VFDAATGGRDYGETLLKLAPVGNELKARDYFTPFDQAQLSRDDADLGGGGPVLISRQPASGVRFIVVGGKGGVIYVLNADLMGKFHEGSNANALQTIALGKSIKSAPAYWNGHVYYVACDDVLRDFATRGGHLQLAGISREQIREPGATPTISANGTTDGIVWFIETRIWNGTDRNAVLHAYDAADVTHELYSSDNKPADQAGIARRFNIPTVANGRVYVGCSREVDVYGLLAAHPARLKQKAETLKRCDYRRLPVPRLIIVGCYSLPKKSGITAASYRGMRQRFTSFPTS
jgi:hypothetical protein